MPRESLRTPAHHEWPDRLFDRDNVHLVFTMPEPLARLAPSNKRVYDLLFRAAAATLLQVAANPTRLRLSSCCNAR
ncbi:MAG TPA: hypothetical protein VMO47_09360 [Rhodothermales bacterium]|nr:hypothetical protein [Rhodothermales bacterium]